MAERIAGPGPGIWTGSEFIVDSSRYQADNDTWQTVAVEGAPRARINHSLVWSGSEMIVWGGMDPEEAGGVLADGARYDPVGDNWTPVVTTGGAVARSGHIAVWTGTEMIVWGGASTGGNSGDRYDPTTNSWSRIPTDGAPSARGGSVAVWTGTEMVVWGGCCGDGGAHLDSGARYRP